MIKKKSNTFQVFFTIPILSLPGGPGDVSIVSDQNTVGWYIGPHRLGDRRAHELPQFFKNASRVYVQARRNGWVVSVACTLSFFEIRGRQHINHLLPRDGAAVTACCLENIRCYTRILFLPWYLKKVYNLQVVFAHTRKEARNVAGLFHLRFQYVWHESGKRWSTN